MDDETAKIAAFRRNWNTAQRDRQPPPSMPDYMIDKWRHVCDEIALYEEIYGPDPRENGS